jgi:hypothetical protein
MIWKKPHIARIYEALTVIADGRIEINGNQGKCYSITNDKVYDIQYNPMNGSIMSNDNAAFYTNSLSYPMIAYLMLIGKIPYQEKLLEIFKDVCWKEVNIHFKNDYDKSIKFVLGGLKKEGRDTDFIRNEVKRIYDFICSLQIKTLGELQRPIK